MTDLTWFCDICERQRPDDKISVRKIDISARYGLLPGQAEKRIKYCNDDERCTREAKEKKP